MRVDLSAPAGQCRYVWNHKTCLKPTSGKMDICDDCLNERGRRRFAREQRASWHNLPANLIPYEHGS